MVTNFDYLKNESKFSAFANVAISAEKIILADPDASILNSRRAMEFAVKWMYSVAEMSRISDSDFKYSPYTSAFSFIIPIFNLILPCRIVWSALKSAINAAKEKISAFDLALFATWWICWAITATVFLTEKFTRSNGLENIQVSIYFSMYVIFTIITTSVLWLALVSRISNLYRRIYSNG